MKSKKKMYLMVLPVLLVSVLFFYFFTPVKPITAVGNQTILDEVNRLESLAQRRNLNLDDISNLRELVRIDHVAEDEYKEMEWLISHEEYSDSFHTLTFLKQYVSTGYEFLCVTHELRHMKFFIQYDDKEFLEHELEKIDEAWPLWLEKLDVQRERWPTTVENLEQKVPFIIEQLKNGNYSQKVFNLIDEVYSNSVC